MAEVLAVLEGAGHSAHVVGGTVRDHLLGRPVHDFDIATSARPEEVMALFDHTIATGVRHGTVTVVLGGLTVEVTTYRLESGYSDGRRPDCVWFTDDLVADLARRDFTVNAMAMDLRGRLIDPFGGRADLLARRLRAVGDPRQRLGEDALRILRGVRLAAELGFAIEPGTLAGMTEQAARLLGISRERIGQELARLLQADWWHVLPWFAAGPWLEVLPSPWPRLRHGLARLAARADEASAWRALCPDGAEARVCVSAVTWMVAADEPPDTAGPLARAVAWPNRRGRRVRDLAEVVRLIPTLHGAAAWRRFLFRRDPDDVRTGAALCDWFSPGKAPNTVSWAETAHRWLRTQPLWHLTDLAFDGQDALRLGVRGPDVGKLLQALADAVLQGEVANEHLALCELARRWVQGKHSGGRGGDG